MLFVILKNEIPHSHRNWVEACKTLGIDYSIVELTADTWLEEVVKYKDEETHFLVCPSGVTSGFKKMYDERLYIVAKVLMQRVYPSYESVILHENKRMLAYWLKATKIPHPETHIIYNKKEALSYADCCNYPVVVKTNIGASGNGVRIIRNKSSAFSYVKKAFSKDGIRQKTGPNLHMGAIKKRIINFIKNSEHRRTRLREYKSVLNDPQKGFVIFQEYIHHDFEWRVVKIGSAYFGHQKVKVGDKASGTKGIDYVSPPIELLDFVKSICEEHNFFTMAVDVFESPTGDGYLVNEMQCIFGHVQDYICEQNGEQGKFEKVSGKWEFVSGVYNKNLSYNERLKQYINLS